MKGNKLLFGASAGGLFVIIVVLSVVFKSEGVKHVPMSGVPKDSSDPAMDSQHNTLLAIQAKITDITNENGTLKDDNERILRRNNELEKTLTQYGAKLSSLETDLHSVKPDIVERLSDYERKLEKSVAAGAAQIKEKSGLFDTITSLPASAAGSTDVLKPKSDTSDRSLFSLPSRAVGGLPRAAVASSSAPANVSESPFTWHTPSNRPDYDPKKIKPVVEKKAIDSSVSRRFTINPLATGFDAVAVTALVGRIPLAGKTNDPYRAKILIGKDNLAANGYFFDGVAGMVVGGWATGDWNLTCVKVNIDSYAFVFDDGTIVSKESGGSAKDSYGYISMPNGFPCVPGEFHTNAPSFLLQQIGLAGIQAAGEAYAAAAATTEDLPLGGQRTEITDTGDYVLGSVVSRAVDESLKWITERQQNSFDAVVAPPGVKVSVHFEKTIEIDYDKNGRKVNHENQLALQTVID